jgi:hypothetical protein
LILPYWRSGTPELLAASAAARHGRHPRAAASMPPPDSLSRDFLIQSSAAVRSTSAAPAAPASRTCTTSPPPEQQRLLVEQAHAAAAAAALQDRMPAIYDLPRRSASLPPPAAVLRRGSSADHLAAAAADATASFSVTTVAATSPRSTTAGLHGTFLSPPAEQLWEHWRTPLAALQAASPSPRSTSHRGPAVTAAAAAATASSLPPDWSGRAPVARFRFAPHAAASAAWERPASVGAFPSARAAGSGAASVVAPRSVFSQLRHKVREVEVRAASAAPAAVEEEALAHCKGW